MSPFSFFARPLLSRRGTSNTNNSSGCHLLQLNTTISFPFSPTSALLQLFRSSLLVFFLSFLRFFFLEVMSGVVSYFASSFFRLLFNRSTCSRRLLNPCCIRPYSRFAFFDIIICFVFSCFPSHFPIKVPHTPEQQRSGNKRRWVPFFCSRGM